MKKKEWNGLLNSDARKTEGPYSTKERKNLLAISYAIDSIKSNLD